MTTTTREPRRRATKPRRLTLPTRGPYDLAAVATLGFGHRDEPDFDGTMRAGFCLDDDYAEQVVVAISQHGDELEVVVHGPGDLDRIAAQVARFVSVDHDGAGFAALGATDPVLGRVQRAAPGFRPALFYSPYEAAVWAVLSARRSRAQGIRLRQRLIEAHGTFADVAGVPVGVLPTPAALRAVDGLGGLPADRVPRLHAIADAASRGELSAARLHELGPERADAELQRLPGIGPFYASLVVVRAAGFVDVPATREPMLLDLLRRLYGLADDAPAAEVLAVTDGWAPFRTWAGVLTRAVGERVLAEEGGETD